MLWPCSTERRQFSPTRRPRTLTPGTTTSVSDPSSPTDHLPPPRDHPPYSPGPLPSSPCLSHAPTGIASAAAVPPCSPLVGDGKIYTTQRALLIRVLRGACRRCCAVKQRRAGLCRGLRLSCRGWEPWWAVNRRRARAGVPRGDADRRRATAPPGPTELPRRRRGAPAVEAHPPARLPRILAVLACRSRLFLRTPLSA